MSGSYSSHTINFLSRRGGSLFDQVLLNLNLVSVASIWLCYEGWGINGATKTNQALKQKHLPIRSLDHLLLYRLRYTLIWTQCLSYWRPHHFTLFLQLLRCSERLFYQIFYKSTLQNFSIRPSNQRWTRVCVADIQSEFITSCFLCNSAQTTWSPSVMSSL